MIFDKLKSEASSSIETKLLSINSNKYNYSYVNLQLISLNGHLSSHQKNIPIHQNSPNIYHP